MLLSTFLEIVSKIIQVFTASDISAPAAPFSIRIAMDSVGASQFFGDGSAGQPAGSAEQPAMQARLLSETDIRPLVTSIPDKQNHEDALAFDQFIFSMRRK